MSQRLRVVLVATFISITVGATFAAAVVVASETTPLLPRLSASLLFDLAFIAVVSSVLPGAPLGIAGGFFADAMLRRYGTSMPRVQWAGRGAVAGAAAGALGAALYAVLLSQGDFASDLEAITALYFTCGAICGGIAGCLVGFWCAREVRRGQASVAKALA